MDEYYAYKEDRSVKTISAEFWLGILWFWLGLVTNNTTYHDFNCFDVIIDNYYVITTL